MKNIELRLDDHEFQRSKGIKGHNRTWKEFFLQLAGIKKKADDDE